MHLKDGSKSSMTCHLKMTDEEYMKLLDRIIKGAEYLANPLIKQEDYEKGIKLYDELCTKATKIRCGNWGN